MKITAIIGGVAVTIIVLAAGIVFCVAGVVFILRYILPGLLIFCALKFVWDLTFGRQAIAG